MRNRRTMLQSEGFPLLSMAATRQGPGWLRPQATVFPRHLGAHRILDAVIEVDFRGIGNEESRA